MAAALFDTGFLRKLEMLTLVARQTYRGSARGERRSTAHGASVEFADFRPYVQGDDFRRIDWLAYAKFETLMLRLFVEEQELNVHILLDSSASMDYGTPNKFVFARQMAAALAYVALANTDRVTITPIQTNPDTGTVIGAATRPVRGKAGILPLLQQLERFTAEGTTDLNAALEMFAVRTTRPGLVILISDLLTPDGIERGLARVRYAKHEVALVQVLAPQELKPDLLGDLRLVDAETQQPVEISASRSVLQAYAKRLADFLAGLAALARQHNGTHVLAPTDADFDDLILKQLRALGLVK